MTQVKKGGDPSLSLIWVKDQRPGFAPDQCAKGVIFQRGWWSGKDGPKKSLPSESATARPAGERPPPGIEIELIGGRRVRFDHEVDPETVPRLVPRP